MSSLINIYNDTNAYSIAQLTGAAVSLGLQEMLTLRPSSAYTGVIGRGENTGAIGGREKINQMLHKILPST